MKLHEVASYLDAEDQVIHRHNILCGQMFQVLKFAHQNGERDKVSIHSTLPTSVMAIAYRTIENAQKDKIHAVNFPSTIRSLSTFTQN
jgi:hypothetical protein